MTLTKPLDLVSSFFLQTQKAYEKDAMDKDMVLKS